VYAFVGSDDTRRSQQLRAGMEAGSSLGVWTEQVFEVTEKQRMLGA
jgi:hypothetical protein